MTTLWDRFVAEAGPRDYLTLIGVTAMTVGLARIYTPAAWLFVGGFCLWLAFRTPARVNRP